MHKGFLKAAALFGILSVILGAFAAHTLKGIVSDHAITTFEIAVRYQFYHVFALLGAGILYKDFGSKMIRWAGRLFIAGIILFSGSLYGLAMLQAMVKPGYKWLGPVTPLGGLCLIAGWLLLFISFFRKN